METLNKKQAQKLFNENSVYIDGKDVILEKTMIELFGDKVTQYVKTTFPEGLEELFFDNGLVPYFKENGFFRAVSYYNVFRFLEKKDRTG
ncbi:MAG: hypothetical protein IJG85_05090 [Eubacteriaceae bacterium]|nr:hypothetical protein [Eubacteriaceae bacterium]